jgi:hypothetical protein
MTESGYAGSYRQLKAKVDECESALHAWQATCPHTDIVCGYRPSDELTPFDEIHVCAICGKCERWSDHGYYKTFTGNDYRNVDYWQALEMVKSCTAFDAR